MTKSLSRRWSARSILVFSVIMLIKSYLTWTVLFEGSSFNTVWLKELPFILIVFCFIEWFAVKRKLWWYLFVNLLITVLFFTLIVYFRHFGIIPTYHVLEQADQVGAVKKSIFSVIHPKYLLIYMDILILGYVLLRRRIAVDWKRALTVRASRKTVAAVFSISLFACLFNILPHTESINETVQAEQMGILNYEAYSLLEDDEETPVQQNLITQSTIHELKGITEPATPVLFGKAKGKNVIILQMESFQNFLIDLKIDGQEITPVMNKLAHGNYYFPRFYQQVGQGNTSDAEFVVNTSFYVPPDGPATQIYAKKELPSMAKLLESHGYDTATFHTNEVGFWNRDELYEGLGFNRYYDKTFFGEGNDELWFGPSDEVLYSKTAEELQRMDASAQPFYAHVISMSAHNPFELPEEKYKMTLPERFEGTYVGDYIQSQNYADYCLGLFLEDLKGRGLLEDSLLLFYGDHRGLPVFSLDEEDRVLLEEIFGGTYLERDMINVPFVIAGDGVTTPSEFQQLGGQVDILPTLANLLGISMKEQIHFGQDLLNQKQYNLLPQRYYLPTGSFVNNEELFLPGSGFEDGKHYTLSGSDSTEASASTEDEFNRALELLHLSDSYVSQLPDQPEPEDRGE
ncbi:LTA synthase family protein [Paenibacillus sp. LHD-117]|uniref:LTA synthase family protein n=1 Tax=Paenibacillus sp. LHD-117 TaxID=3071412 RepID=UPI0027E032BC|nr:LTA synthase family protein [Paenibacillus sp. LHD-117]MDQ6419751.1 LTA synthase family protein [Paenibacillus sp. LHD-117]